MVLLNSLGLVSRHQKSTYDLGPIGAGEFDRLFDENIFRSSIAVSIASLKGRLFADSGVVKI